ncbi:MAG: ABC transporter ATP-binding protein [Syntrophomonadaceae bacterium]|nr:ABC transporter ATP-binding protein [Syntrophomonadaceae bacterium]
MDKPLLMRLENVSKQYHMGEVVVDALQPSSLDIYVGELIVVLGPSGSGKSTLLNLMGGMDRPSDGKIFFGKQDVSAADEGELTNFRRQQVGFVFQFYNLIPDLTAAENVALAASLIKEPMSVSAVLEEVGLSARAKHFPAHLSGGEQQRVSIARAIVKRPPLLLCDEPTGALDYQTGISILALLRQITSTVGSTVIIVTHNTAIAAMADRVVRMRSGIIAEVTSNDIPLAPERIEW